MSFCSFREYSRNNYNIIVTNQILFATTCELTSYKIILQHKRVILIVKITYNNVIKRYYKQKVSKSTQWNVLKEEYI